MNCECVYENGVKVRMCKKCKQAMIDYRERHYDRLKGMVFDGFDKSYKGYFAGASGFNKGLRKRTIVSLTVHGGTDYNEVFISAV